MIYILLLLHFFVSHSAVFGLQDFKGGSCVLCSKDNASFLFVEGHKTSL